MLESGHWVGASIMQLPQHGTARSLNSSFYDAVQPQIVIAQYDAGNRRGDPDIDVISMIGDAPLFRTGEAGTLHLKTDGQDVFVVNSN